MTGKIPTSNPIGQLLLVNKYHKIAPKEDSKNRPGYYFTWNPSPQVCPSPSLEPKQGHSEWRFRTAQLFYLGPGYCHSFAVHLTLPVCFAITLFHLWITFSFSRLESRCNWEGPFWDILQTRLESRVKFPVLRVSSWRLGLKRVSNFSSIS